MFDSRDLSRLTARGALAVLLVLACSTSIFAQWIAFDDETGTRLSASPGNGVSDVEEKDYAWGDVDQDGDIDLVVVRKEPFTSPGKRTNVLLMNENGVLTDRTADFATASNITGDNGFNTPTNDRDVQLVDLTGDGWLDIVTATTLSDGDSKAIGHPRIYVNLGNDGGGNWLGFRHEDQRIPTMLSYSGQSNFNPRFCSVAVGDVTGDGSPDLWFGDYDSSGAGGFGQPAGADYNDRLLVNNGAGFFTDVTSQRFAGQISIPNSTNTSFEVSAFGAAAVIADMNGDSINDIVKQTSLNDPLYVGIAYNDAVTEGFFDTYEVVYDNAPYFVSVDDLNNDGQLDMVITDDGADRYLLNQGNDPDGTANFLSFTFSYDAASDDGFGSNSLIADLNKDGFKDVMIADVDVDISGCSRRMHIYRNLGGQPGDNITLQEQTTGTGCATNQGNPASCVVASIPSNMLEGVHDMAVFDLNGDSWLDIVLGRCASTEVYIADPPVGLQFTYPQGLQAFVSPDSPATFQIQVSGIGVSSPVTGTAALFASVDGGPLQGVLLNHLGNDLYETTLPVSTCGSEIQYYVWSKATQGGFFTDPPGAPTELFSAVSAIGTEVNFEDSIEGDVSGWTVINDGSLTAGGWEQAVPNGTLTGGGEQAAPDEDAEAQSGNTRAFVTQNGTPGGSVGAADVDGGPTDLISPAIDLAGTDAVISYQRWFFTDGDDSMTVWVTADGSNWQLVETVTGGANNSWTVSSFKVGNYVTPSASVQVRFRVSDSPNNSVTEGGIDVFRVLSFVCGECTFPADCDDGNFCNGAESCTSGFCIDGPEACPGQECDEVGDACVECVVDAHCDDGNFCNGAEVCTGNSCGLGSDPCPAQLCDEVNDTCTACLVDSECDDGLFCNGAEICTGGVCATSGDACPDRGCDEGGDVCTGPVVLQPPLGAPILGLDPAETARFDAGRIDFDTVLTELNGLGPIFNQNSCSSCHSKAVGGSGSIMVQRFGFNDDKAGGFDPLDSLGGSLRQSQSISPACSEVIPPEANVVANRVTNSTLGGGLVEAIPDSALEFRANTPPAGVSGRTHMVLELEDLGGPQHVGRFGWKAQLSSVLSFSADAALNEMGLTNRLLVNENAPNGDQVLLASCDTVADPEDGPDGQGLHFIDRVTDFQRFTAAPPQTPRSGMSGESIFNAIGCASCHATAFRTADDPALPTALRDKSFRPYSDFLLHDMGANADFIVQGGATSTEMRTPPLWGLRVRDPLWHDGRVSGSTFAFRMTESISLHDSLGSEGTPSAQAFAALPQADKDAVIAFLDSLGRAEYDHNGDGGVDQLDFNELALCFTGPGNFYTPDDPCSISDIDQDGDVDDDDFALFQPGGDGDGDGQTNSTDCAPFDGNEWARPSPALNLLIAEGGSQDTLTWSPPSSPGSTAPTYDVLRSSSFTDFSSATCVEVGGSDLTAVDNASPAAGQGEFYLIRSRTTCGDNLGAASSGTERTGFVCD